MVSDSSQERQGIYRINLDFIKISSNLIRTCLCVKSLLEFDVFRLRSRFVISSIDHKRSLLPHKREAFPERTRYIQNS